MPLLPTSQIPMVLIDGIEAQCVHQPCGLKRGSPTHHSHLGWIVEPSKLDFTWKSEILSLAVLYDTVGRGVSCRSCLLIINLHLYSSPLSVSELHRWQHKICQKERLNYRWALFAYPPPLFFFLP